MLHRPSRSRFLPLRGLRCHVREWGPVGAPMVVMLHGWMDVGASFQFVVDALAAREGPSRYIVAGDWRGFGGSQSGPAGVAVDAFWVPDYLGDLDALLDALSPGGPVDLLGHSMGGNVAMSYAGVRPQRVRRLANLEAFGMPATHPAQAPKRLSKWLDELKTPARLRDYASLAEVAARLRQNNPRMAQDRSLWLAAHWSVQKADGRFHVLGDPAHKRTNPVLYHREEVVECWRAITAPLLWVEGDATDVAKWWGNAYPRSDFESRLAVVPQVERHVLADCGHMLHHDHPEALAALLQAFLDRE